MQCLRPVHSSRLSARTAANGRRVVDPRAHSDYAEVGATNPVFSNSTDQLSAPHAAMGEKRCNCWKTHGRRASYESAISPNGILSAPTTDGSDLDSVGPLTVVREWQTNPVVTPLAGNRRHFVGDPVSRLGGNSSCHWIDGWVAAAQSPFEPGSCLFAGGHLAAMSEERGLASCQQMFPEPQRGTARGDVVNEGECDMATIETQKEILCNPTLATQCAGLIDLTDFGTVRRHAKSPQSPISMVMLLSEEYRLAEFAALCMEPTIYQEAVMIGLMTNKAVRFAVNSVQIDDDGILRIPIDQIPDDQLCEVVYLPPAYLVQLRTH